MAGETQMKDKPIKIQRHVIKRVEELIRNAQIEVQDNEGTVAELTELLFEYRQTGKISKTLQDYLD